MAQRSTDTDRVGLRLLPPGRPVTEGNVSVELRTRRRRWGPAFEDLKLWRSLDSRARRYEVAAVIEYDQSDQGPQNVTASAVIDGVGVRWLLEPSNEPGGRPEEHILEVHSRDGHPVGQRILSRLGLGRVHEALTEALATPGAATVLGERWGAVVAPRPGRRGRPDLFYAQVALEYVQALEHDPKRPVRWMLAQAATRDEHLTSDELRARLRRARRRQLLSDAPPGQPGGELTDKAKRLLREVGLIDQEGGDDGER